MAETKPTLTLTDLLNHDAPAATGDAQKISSPLGDRAAIEKRTRFMREKAGSTDLSQPEQAHSLVTHEPSDLEPKSVVSLPDRSRPVAKQTTVTDKTGNKVARKSDEDKITRSIQFSRATYRQMEKTLNFIAYKSGCRHVSFPRYFEKLHDLARQDPDLMNQLINHFKTDLPD